MPTQITINRQRVKVDNILLRQGALTDILTGQPLFMWQSEDCQHEIGVYTGGVKVDDLTNYTSFTLLVKDPGNLKGAPLISKTVSGGSISAVSDATWTNGSGQDFVFTMTAAETNIELNGAASRKLRWVLAGLITTGSKRTPISSGDITLVDSAYGDLGSITVTPPGARMQSNQFQLYNADTGLYHPAYLKTLQGRQQLIIEQTGQA